MFRKCHASHSVITHPCGMVLDCQLGKGHYGDHCDTTHKAIGHVVSWPSDNPTSFPWAEGLTPGTIGLAAVGSVFMHWTGGSTDTETMLQRLADYAQDQGFTIEPLSLWDVLNGEMGYTTPMGKVIALNPTLDPERLVQVLAHEVGHIVLGHLSTVGNTVSQEHEADSWASDLMVRNGLSDSFIRDHDASDMNAPSYIQR